jgi:class 3 adenylate cyclase
VIAPSKDHLETICVIDDEPELNDLLKTFLEEQQYRVLSFASGQEFLKWQQASNEGFGLIISDINMPGLSGYGLCKQIRARAIGGQRTPIILVTQGNSGTEKAMGIEAGADDFIQKPYNFRELLAKIRALLDQAARELERQDELASARERTERLGKLTRFLPSRVGEILTSDSAHKLLEPHRREVSVMFVDLRRFTAFSGRVEPEEVLEVLGQYYTAVGAVVLKHGGTLGHLAGDGMMIFFNDPDPMPDHQEVAVQTALEIRDAMEAHKVGWRKREYDIDYGIGIAQGYATIGGIGFENFWQYSVIGPVTNFAARLCQVADNGQILVSKRFLGRMGDDICQVEAIRDVKLKGISTPVLVHNVLSIHRAQKPQAA